MAKTLSNGWNIKGQVGHVQSPETKAKISTTMKGYKKSAEHQAKITKALKGRKMPEGYSEAMSKRLKGKKRPDLSKILKGKHNSSKTEFKEGFIPWIKGKSKKDYPQLSNSGIKRGMMVGEKNHLWKGGITLENKRIRTTSEYKDWRRTIFIRDEFICQDCGIKHTYIEAHHIKSFAYYPKLRFNTDNGLTLCKPCHSKTKNYKGKNYE